jgi:aromatic ring hydroxylase
LIKFVIASKIISINTFEYQEEQMALMTPEQFEESLKQMNPRVYMNGKKVENVLDNPNTRTVVESNKASYRWALDSRTARGRHLAWRGTRDGPEDYASTRR